jgi:hypothetical protein
VKTRRSHGVISVTILNHFLETLIMPSKLVTDLLDALDKLAGGYTPVSGRFTPEA